MATATVVKVLEGCGGGEFRHFAGSMDMRRARAYRGIDIHRTGGTIHLRGKPPTCCGMVVLHTPVGNGRGVFTQARLTEGPTPSCGKFTTSFRWRLPKDRYAHGRYCGHRGFRPEARMIRTKAPPIHDSNVRKSFALTAAATHAGRSLRTRIRKGKKHYRARSIALPTAAGTFLWMLHGTKPISCRYKRVSTWP